MNVLLSSFTVTSFLEWNWNRLSIYFRLYNIALTYCRRTILKVLFRAWFTTRRSRSPNRISPRHQKLSPWRLPRATKIQPEGILFHCCGTTRRLLPLLFPVANQRLPVLPQNSSHARSPAALRSQQDVELYM